jgi:hypothetical protein
LPVYETARTVDADSDPVALREVAGLDRKLLVAQLIFSFEPVTADRAQIALNIHTKHLLELAPQMARDQM